MTMSEVHDPHGGAPRAPSSRPAAWALATLVAVLVCALAAPAAARPLGQPYRLDLFGVDARVVFNEQAPIAPRRCGTLNPRSSTGPSRATSS
jgi:hypothetical protein